MKILALEHGTPNATAEAFRTMAEDEARKVWELHLSGKNLPWLC